MKRAFEDVGMEGQQQVVETEWGEQGVVTAQLEMIESKYREEGACF